MSFQAILEYYSSFADRWFGQYDYGAAGNIKKYGSPNPPKYDLSKIKVPITLMYSADDWLSSHEVNINFTIQMPTHNHII